jgi:MFS family permease
MSDEGTVTTLWPPMVRAFAYRNFRLLFAGQLVSLIGNWIQNLAVAWLVYRLTDSPAMLGVASFANLIPGFLLSPVAGMLADRLDRRRIMMTAQAIAALLALLLALLTLSHHVQVWQVLAIGMLLGSAAAFEIPARNALVAEIVARTDLPNAIALHTTAFNTSRVIGPAIAGALVALVGEGWCFLINAASFLPVIFCVLALRMTRRATEPKDKTALRAILEGFQHFANSPALRTTVIAATGISLFGNTYTTLMPVMAARMLRGGPHTLGLLMGAAGFGALLAALALAARRSHIGISRWIGTGTLGIGIFLIAFAWSPWLWLSMPLMAGVGACWVLGTTSANTLFQSLIPDALRGRAASMYLMIMMGGTPLGGLLGGALAELIGAPATLSCAGTVCVGFGLWYSRRMRQIRQTVQG